MFFSFGLSAGNKYDWYYDKLRDNELYLYGVGNSDIDIEYAVKKAMDNIVRGVFENSSEILNIDYESFRKSFNFPSYNIENNAKSDGVWYVLISVKRNELFELQLNNLDEIDKNITKSYNFLKNKNEFVKIKNVDKLLKLIKKAEDKIEVIWTINEFNETKYTDRYKRIIKEYKELSKNLNINIKVENTEIKDSKSEIEYYFNKKNIKVKEKSNNTLYVSYVNRKLPSNNSFDNNIFLTVKFMDKDNNMLYYNSYVYDTKINNISNNINDKIILLLDNFFGDINSLKVDYDAWNSQL
jgi:hypothetical protein